ncbi:MAG: LamG domain-containing protein [Verrucomicrobiae bacterium]|nr:LamG domain-containing protein [Verrucomicrobiae bacterium]
MKSVPSIDKLRHGAVLLIAVLFCPSSFGQDGCVARWSSEDGLKVFGTRKIEGTQAAPGVYAGAPELDASARISIEAWIKAGRNAKRDPIVCKGANYQVCLERNQVLFIYMSAKGDEKTWHGYRTHCAIKPGDWQHLVISYAYGRPDGMRCYVDGKQVDGHWYSGNGREPVVVDAGKALFVGKKDDTVFSGQIGELSIHDRETPLEQARDLHALGIRRYQKNGHDDRPFLSDAQRGELAGLEAKIGKYRPASPDGRFWAKRLLDLSKDIAKKNGCPDVRENSRDAEAQMRTLKKLARALFSGKLSSQSHVLYVVNPIDNRRILPDSIDVPGEISDTLLLTAAPGEFEPASFVIQAVEKVGDLKFTVSSLRDARGKTVSGASVDLRVVKCWFQDLGVSAEGYYCQEQVPNEKYNPTYWTGRAVMVPELLLYDDGLVKPEPAIRENYLKLSFAGGKATEYFLPFSRGWGNCYPSAAAFPFVDDRQLLPVDIPENSNKQFWLTVRMPDHCPAGIFDGKIAYESGANARVKGEVKIRVKVLPFALCEPYYISSMYYYPPEKIFYRDYAGQMRREFVNMREHGVSNPHIPFWGGSMAEYLKIRSEAGMSNKVIFYSKVVGNPREPEGLEKVRRMVGDAFEQAKPFGVEQIYFYGLDEAKGDVLVSQRKAWKTVHEAGGKIFVAGHVGNFETVGDIQDLIVMNGYPSREEAKNWHSANRLIMSYANPQGGVEQSETYRRNFGLLLWQNDYDGASTWMHCEDSFPTRRDMGADRNCFMKQSCMVYRTANGVLDTVQWEGYREGVDDVRYVTTLQKLIGKTRGEGDEKSRKAVMEAESYLAKLKDDDLSRRSLGTVRLEIIGHILKILGREE